MIRRTSRATPRWLRLLPASYKSEQPSAAGAFPTAGAPQNVEPPPNFRLPSLYDSGTPTQISRASGAIPQWLLGSLEPRGWKRPQSLDLPADRGLRSIDCDENVADHIHRTSDHSTLCTAGGTHLPSRTSRLGAYNRSTTPKGPDFGAGSQFAFLSLPGEPAWI